MNQDKLQALSAIEARLQLLERRVQWLTYATLSMIIIMSIKMGWLDNQTATQILKVAPAIAAPSPTPPINNDGWWGEVRP